MSGPFYLLCLTAIGAFLLLAFAEDVVVAAHYEDPIPASWCPDSFYNFGDSLTDTGNALHFAPPGSLSSRLPYGEAFFGEPTGRFSDGRLVIDYILLSFKLPLLTPSWKATATQTGGSNFAYAGATAARVSVSTSCLEDQVSQFVEWKTLAENSTYLSGGDSNLFKNLSISSALFMIEAGGNDLFKFLMNGYKYDDLALLTGPALLKAIVKSVQALYLEGGRKFLIHSIPAQGCSPSVRFFGVIEKYGFHLDSLGCADELNAFNRAVNEGLHLAVKDLRGSMPDATIIYFDQFAFNLEVLNNPAKYGFDPDHVSDVCYPLHPDGRVSEFESSYVRSGDSGTQLCNDPEQYVNWDGVHFTEHYYRVLAEFLLSGVYSDPPTNLTALCNLTYKNFGPDVTYEDVYPPTNVGVSSSI